MAADNDLLIVVQLDGRPALAALSQVEGAAGRVTGAVTQLDAGFQQLQGGLVVPKSTADELNRIAAAALSIPREMPQLVAANAVPRQVGDELERIATNARNIPSVPRQIVPPGAVDPGVAPALQGVTTAGGAAQQTMFGLAATFDDAQQFQYGFSQGIRATTNNLQPLIQGFAQMQAQAAATGVSLGSTIGAALLGPAGILIGLTLVAAAAPKIADALDDAFTTASERAAEAATSVDQLFESARATAEEFEAAADAVFKFSLETDSFTVSSEAQAESMATVLVQDRDATKARIESVQATINAAAATNAYNGFIGETSGPLDQLRRDLRAANDELLEQETLLKRVRDAQRLFSLQQRAVAFGNEQGLQTDAEREAAERASREAARDAERERKRGIREAATAERRAEREALTAQRKAATEARRLGEQRARLDLQIRVETTREGTERVLEQLRQENVERLALVASGSQLEANVRIAYSRAVGRVLEDEIQKREDSLLGSLDRIRQAREAADQAAGVTGDTVARERVAQIQAEAEGQVDLAATRARLLGDEIEDRAELARLIQSGTFAEAEGVATLVAENPALKAVLDLMLERLALEGQIAGAIATRREEAARTNRADLRAEDELEARRQRANSRIADPGQAADPAADAEAKVERLFQALGDVDAEIARVSGARVEDAAEVASAVAAAEQGVAEVVVDGQRYTVEELKRLAEERKQINAEVDEAVVAGSEQAADRAVETYKRQLDAVREAAGRTIDAIGEAFSRQRKYTDLDIEAQRARYAQDEKDLRDSLRNKELSQREYNLQLRLLAQDRGDFERSVAEDQKTVGDALLADSLGFAKQVATNVISAEIAKGTAGYFADVLKFFGFLGPFAPVAAAATVPAMLGVFKSVIPGFATGGSVSGRGTGTSDEVLAWLSNGEHIITAQAARGQHGALALLNAQMEAGLDLEELLRMMATSGRFATGGAFLTPRPVPARPVLSSSSVGPAGLDLAPVVAELQQSRRDSAALVAEVRRLAVPHTVVTDADALRLSRRAQRQAKLRGARS